MTKISMYSCLLCALSIVEMKPLNINGHVGKSVTIKCSDWDARIGVKSNVKYFCHSPCSKDKHIIIKAAFGKTTYEKRIELTNTAEGLFVTFTNLQKSDSKTYYCGVERFGPDSFIEVNLKVTDAESSSPTTTPKALIIGSTLSVAVTDSFTMSSNGSESSTDMSTSYRTINTTLPSASATQAGSVPYLIVSVIIITILMVLLTLMSNMMKQLKDVSCADTPQEDAQEDVAYDEIRPEDQTVPDCLYANYSYHQDTELAPQSSNNYSEDVYTNSISRYEVNSRGACAENRVTDPQRDLVYSVAQMPKEQFELTGQSESNQFEIENDSFYSLAQLPHASCGQN